MDKVLVTIYVPSIEEEFDVYSHDKFYERIKLHVPGMHNVLNTLGCI